MTDRYAVVGNPVAHSRSPAIHARFARQTGQDIEYGRLLAPLDGFGDTVATFRRDGGCGLNVTLPFKLEAWTLATSRTPRAEAAGAVNTLRFDGDAIVGDNTDGAGLVRDIEQRLRVTLAGRSVLMLGAGGAARGALLPLLQAGVARLAIANRSADKARALVADMRSVVGGERGSGEGRPIDGIRPIEPGRLSAVDFADLAPGYDVIINATSTGLQSTELPVPAGVLARALLAYDMFYAAAPTAFMRQAERAGCARAADGLGMLIEQAAESFLLWRGVRPDTAEVYAALRAELTADSH
ncbi:MAG: shikimate dehydrogenase [Burkholderiales bacterium]|nr:shikimate dehydrogenase [Burkholderiales bacterium]ODU62693.1 MAG: shikimate dehydrogenase [Lautropia sp. SCN 66-9]